MPGRTVVFDVSGVIELADNAAISAAFSRKRAVFSARPCYDGDKGSLERANGPVRRRHPRGTDFLAVPVAELQETEHQLNLRPLRVLGGNCPAHFLPQLLRWRA